MSMKKPVPGTQFPSLEVNRLGVGTLTLGKASVGSDWQMIVVYRGKHCPICTRYLKEVNAIVGPLKELGIEVVAVSADSQARAEEQIDQVKPDFAVGYGLSVAQMQEMGLYITDPREGVDVEGPFAEPGLFVVNETGELRMVDIATVPFFRPQLSSLVGGLKYVRGMTAGSPATGTFD